MNIDSYGSFSELNPRKHYVDRFWVCSTCMKPITGIMVNIHLHKAAFGRDSEYKFTEKE